MKNVSRIYILKIYEPTCGNRDIVFHGCNVLFMKYPRTQVLE